MNRHGFAGVAIVLLGMSLLPACTTAHVIGLYRHSSFTYPAVVEGKMGVGGVTSFGPLSDTDRLQYTALLRTSFLVDRPRFQMIPASGGLVRLDTAAYNAMLDEYRSDGQLSEVRLDALSTNVKDCRYLVFARIETDRVSQSSSSEPVKNENGESTGSVTTRLSTTRVASVFLSIYDLRMRILAWSGTIEERVSRSSNYSGEERNFWEGVVEALLELDPDYPAPARLGEVLKSVFDGFAENMPSKSERLSETPAESNEPWRP